MTFLHPPLIAAALAVATPSVNCSRPITAPGERRLFTNADLERIAACRRLSAARSDPDESSDSESPSRGPQRTVRADRSEDTNDGNARAHALEADWRARWRSVDQRVRRLRREAEELRLEANEAPRDSKKKPTGRRSPSMLLRRAEALMAEAGEIEDEFQTQARREGALPGWLRAR